MKLVAISDTHGRLDFKVPPCDLLIHCGDICPDFAPGSAWGSDMQAQWFRSKFANWLQVQKFADFYFTYGNHDYLNRTTDLDDLTQNRVIDSLVEFPYEDGILKIWFSPWSNQFGSWAWMLDPQLLEKKYAEIPNDVDIIVSHQPPYGLGDEVPERYAIYNNGNTHVGSREFLAAIDRVKPKLVLCGHIHNGRGVYEREWEDNSPALDSCTIYNCSMVDEAYKRVYEPVEIEI